MYKIIICCSTGVTGSVILTRTLTVLNKKEIPGDIDDIVKEFGGDFYEVVYEDGENDE